MTAVSVVMPVYNGEAFLLESIESILQQSFRDFELVVVDDGSTDSTARILGGIRDKRLRLLRNRENLGIARSLNIGLRAARAPLIAQLDADDLAVPDRLQRQLRAFDAEPDLVMLGGQARLIDRNGRAMLHTFRQTALTRMGLRWQSLYTSPFIHSSVMYRREIVLERLGGYDERFRRCEDFALCSRVLHSYPTRNLPDVLVSYRHVPTAAKTRAEAHALPLVRAVIAGNAAQALDVASADPKLSSLINQWPDYCMFLCSSHAPKPPADTPQLPVFLDAFHERLIALEPDSAGQREVEQDMRYFLWQMGWNQLRRGSRGSGLLAASLRRAPAMTLRCTLQQLFAGVWSYRATRSA